MKKRHPGGRDRALNAMDRQLKKIAEILDMDEPPESRLALVYLSMLYRV